TASAVRARVPQRDAAAIRELGGNNGDKAGRLKGGSVAIAAGKYLLLPGDHIIPNNLTMPYAHTAEEVEARIDRLRGPLQSQAAAYRRQRDQGGERASQC